MQRWSRSRVHLAHNTLVERLHHGVLMCCVDVAGRITLTKLEDGLDD